MSRAAEPGHTGRSAALAPRARLVLLAVALLASAAAEASVPRPGVEKPRVRELAFAPLGQDAPAIASRDAASLRSLMHELAPPALAVPEPGAESGFALFAGDELARALERDLGRDAGPSRFALDLGAEDLAHASLALASRTREASFHPLRGLALIDAEPLRGPPDLEEDLRRGLDLLGPETRIGGSGVFLGSRVGGERRLSLGLHWGCGLSGCGLAEDQRKDPLGLCAFGLPCPKAAQAVIDWAGIAVDTSISNIKSAGTLASGMAVWAADVATAGASAGFREASAVAATATGTTSERLASVGRAFVRGQLGSLTHGFSDANDKVAHAKDLVGAGAIDRGTRRGFEGALAGDLDEALRGGAEAMGGVGQLSGTAAAFYAPFAPAPTANPPEQLLTKGGRYEALSEAPVAGTSRSAHRAAANRHVLQTLEEAPSFAEYLSKELGKEVIAHMKSGRGGLRNPPGTEWHHPLENPDVMYLLRRQVHRNPELQGILNDAEGGGGYARHYGRRGR